MIPSLEWCATKAKEAPSPHQVRLILLDTNPVFQCLGDFKNTSQWLLQVDVHGNQLSSILSQNSLFHKMLPLRNCWEKKISVNFFFFLFSLFFNSFCLFVSLFVCLFFVLFCFYYLFNATFTEYLSLIWIFIVLFFSCK